MKIVTVVGARPQFVKAAVVSRAIGAHNDVHPHNPLQEVIVHTGQHYDGNMSKVFFDELSIPRPDYNLEVGSGSHGEMTGKMLARIEEVLLRESPDQVVVYGDTNSTLAGALAAVKLHIPVAHVEAGLRSYNRRMPEEINRVVTDHVSSLLFCPTLAAVANLTREGITSGVHHVGDVMYDAALMFSRIAARKSSILGDLDLLPKQYLLATVHRAENTDDPIRLEAIVRAFGTLAESRTVVFPVHPRTRMKLAGQPVPPSGLRLIDPVSFLDMVELERHARCILTDSGGVQKEAYFHGVPCVTLRDETEWVETVAAGWNQLSGAESNQIIAAVHQAHLGTAIAEYGQGHCAASIVNLLCLKE